MEVVIFVSPVLVSGFGNEAFIRSGEVGGVGRAYAYDSWDRLSTVVDNNLPTGANTATYAYDRCDCHGAK